VNIRQVLALAALVLFTAIGAHADDARIIVGTGGDPFSCGLPDFTINANINHMMNCVNTSGQDWIGLIITGTAKPGKIMFGPGDLACNGTTSDPSNLFNFCNSVLSGITKNKESVTITLSGGEIIPGEDFFINLNDDAGKGGKGGKTTHWEGKLTVTPIVAAPEPGAMSLLLMGLGGVWFWRERRASKSDS